MDCYAYDILHGHTRVVSSCAWNPNLNKLLASGACDSTARLWCLNDAGQWYHKALLQSVRKGETLSSNTWVNCLGWNCDGTLLATGCWDGYARIYSTKGTLCQTFGDHKKPLLLLKWNKNLKYYLLTTEGGKTTTIWDAMSGQVMQQFAFSSLDIDWQSCSSFASVRTDKGNPRGMHTGIHMYNLFVDNPIKSFLGHTGTVNAIKWDQQGRLLASGSDDCTVKIWSMDHDTFVHDFRGHTAAIHSIKWSPTGLGTINPNKGMILASAGLDKSIRLWDVERGFCLRALEKHTAHVLRLAFSPNGQFLASGGLDHWVHIWSTKDGQLVHSHKFGGFITEVCWNATGDKLAASAIDAKVVVFYLRKLDESDSK